MVRLSRDSRPGESLAQELHSKRLLLGGGWGGSDNQETTPTAESELPPNAGAGAPVRRRVGAQARHAQQSPLRPREAGRGTPPGLPTKSQKERCDVLSLPKTLKTTQSPQTWPSAPKLKLQQALLKRKHPSDPVRVPFQEQREGEACQGHVAGWGTRTAGLPWGQFSRRTPHVSRSSETHGVRGLASRQAKHSPETHESIPRNPCKVDAFTTNAKNCLLEEKCSWKAMSDFDIPEAGSGSQGNPSVQTPSQALEPNTGRTVSAPRRPAPGGLGREPGGVGLRGSSPVPVACGRGGGPAPLHGIRDVVTQSLCASRGQRSRNPGVRRFPRAPNLFPNGPCRCTAEVETTSQKVRRQKCGNSYCCSFPWGASVRLGGVPSPPAQERCGRVSQPQVTLPPGPAAHPGPAPRRRRVSFAD